MLAKGTRGLLLFLVLGAALPFGSVQNGYVAILEVGAAIVLGAAWIAGGRVSRKTIRLALLAAAAAAIGWIQFFRGGPSPADTLNAVLRFDAYAALALAASLVFRKPTEFRGAAAALVALATFEALYGSFEFLSGRQHIFGYSKIYYLDSATGTFINRNHFAVFLAMCLPFALALLQGAESGRRPGNWRDRVVRFVEHGFLRRLLPAMAVFVILTGVLLSFSRGGLAAALAGIGVYLLARKGSGVRPTAWILLLMVPVILLSWQAVKAPGERFIDNADNLATVGGRLPAWEAGLKMVRDHPVLGTGYGTFQHVFPAYQPPDLGGYWDHVHNDFLEFLIEGGFVTLGLAAAMVLVLFLPGRGARERGEPVAPFRAAAAGGLAAVLLHACVDFPLRIPAVALLAALLVGLYLASEPVERRDGVWTFPERT